jgi:hypothetical protein
MASMGVRQLSMPNAVRNGTCIIYFNNLLCCNGIVVLIAGKKYLRCSGFNPLSVHIFL